MAQARAKLYARTWASVQQQHRQEFATASTAKKGQIRAELMALKQSED
jgi:hypothetical protein